MRLRSHLASFLEIRIRYLRRSPARSRRPSSLHAVKPLYTARYPRGPGRSRATRSPPDRLGPTRSTWPAWLRPTRVRSPVTSLLGSGHSNTGRTHGSGRLRSQCPITARHMGLTTATPPGPGYIPPARVHAPAGQAQSSRSPRRRTQQATEGVRCGYYDEAYVGARLKLYVQRTLERSCTGRESHTTAPDVWHRVPSRSYRRTCWVRTPSASHRYVSTHLRPRLPINVHIRATSEGASSISRGSVLVHCRGFGTCGWTDVGDPSTRSRLWDPLPWWYDSGERPQRPVGCPTTLARGVGLFRFGPTQSPVLRIRTHRRPLKDGEGGQRAGLGRPGQTSRQPNAKSSATRLR